MKHRLQKVIFLIIVICLLLSLAPSISASVGSFHTTESVRLRTAPSTEADIITVVHPGENVEVLDHDPAGWSSVRVGSSTGFIRSDFLKFPINNTATFATTAGVNVRSAASTTSDVLATVIAGTSVEVSEHDPAGWSKVSVDGTSGYIRSDFLTRGGDRSSAVTPPEGSPSAPEGIGTLKTTGSVNFRAGASTDDVIIKTLSEGTSVEVLENQSNGWSRVRHNDTAGFIRTDLLSASGAPVAATTLKPTGTINLRSGPSTNSSIIRTLSINTSVEVLEQRSDGWSSVKHNETNGFIRSDLLSESTSGGAGSLKRTVTSVNFRSGPSASHSVITQFRANTTVEILEEQSNGWSKVRHNGREGFIKSDLLGAGFSPVELVEWETMRTILQRGRDYRVTDIKTGISYNVRPFALGRHADVDTSSQADTDAKNRTRNGVWSWTARPVWVTVGDRTYAASINGMPHAGSVVSGNGVNGHFCLHFKGSRSHSASDTSSYVRNLQAAVDEAYNARPR